MKTSIQEKARRLARPAGRILLAAAFLVSVGFADSRRKEALCTGLDVRVHSPAGHAFVGIDDIRQSVFDKFGNPAGKPLSSINMGLLEKITNANAYVARAEVFSTVDGKLTIDVVQRNPVLRIINSNGQSFYIDDEGVFMPLSDVYTANVAVANGNIQATLSDRKIRVFTPAEAGDSSNHLNTAEKLFALNRFIGGSPFWSAQVEQMFVDNDGDIELVPRLGSHTVRFGDVNNMEEKFDKLFRFYRQGMNKAGWNTYRTINIEYKDQVVCTKK